MVHYKTMTREELASVYGVSQGYLGYLLREKKVPLPVMLEGEILWFKDEIDVSLPKVMKLIDKRKKKVN